MAKSMDQLINDLLNDPSTSNWLRQQLHIIDRKDIVDQINDTQILLNIQQMKFETMIRQETDTE